jgi:hypothetical protein
MDEKHYLKMRAKADEEYRKNLEALDRVWHMSNPDKPPPVPKTKAQGVEVHHRVSVATLFGDAEPIQTNGTKPFPLSDAVKRVIAQMPEDADISQPIILRRILDIYPEVRPRVQKDQIKAQIAGILSRMTKVNELMRVRDSYGSEPSVFRKSDGVDHNTARPT